MTLEQFQAKIKGGINSDFLSFLHTYCDCQSLIEVLKQYDPKLHKIHDKNLRPDKAIDGNKPPIQVARLTLPIQKNIVMVAAAFLGSPRMEASPENPGEETFVELMEKVWDDNKLDWKFKALAKKVMSVKEAAELWSQVDEPDYWEGYTIRKNNIKLTMQVISPALGDKLYPVFDDFGSLIAFGRQYKTLDDQAKEITHFDLYTADTIYEATQTATIWAFTEKPNTMGKIPVIYYRQPFVEWEDVQSLIERLETKISNHADTNDYFDSPIVVATGEVKGFAEKGDSGKLLQAEEGAKVEYLTWNQAPESTKMEIENLLKFIYKYTHTPDISFESMKGLGQFSGIALKMLFLDAHLKAADKAEIFGEGLQRRINYMKHALTVLDPTLKTQARMKIEPKFEYFLPEDVEGKITTLSAAVSAKILSQETAVRLNPLVQDAEAEIKQLTAEEPEPVETAPVVPLNAAQ